MGLGGWIRRAFGLTSVTPVRSADFESGSQQHRDRADGEMEQAEAWLAALEAGRLNPPQDVHDRGAWDQYWKNHLQVGPLDQGFSDQMSSEPTLPGLLARRGSRPIVCAGNGLSLEAISLALHGFKVTVLDISEVPGAVFGAMLEDPAHPLHEIPGFAICDGRVTFGDAGAIDPKL